MGGGHSRVRELRGRGRCAPLGREASPGWALQAPSAPGPGEVLLPGVGAVPEGTRWARSARFLLLLPFTSTARTSWPWRRSPQHLPVDRRGSFHDLNEPRRRGRVWWKGFVLTGPPYPVPRLPPQAGTHHFLLWLVLGDNSATFSSNGWMLAADLRAAWILSH